MSLCRRQKRVISESSEQGADSSQRQSLSRWLSTYSPLTSAFAA